MKISSEAIVSLTVMLHSVPSMVLDLADSDLKDYPFDSLSFGGAAVPKTLIPKARKNFPKTSM